LVILQNYNDFSWKVNEPIIQDFFLSRLTANGAQISKNKSNHVMSKFLSAVHSQIVLLLSFVSEILSSSSPSCSIHWSSVSLCVNVILTIQSFKQPNYLCHIF
jgi:hypothetical protein